ncbi:unnamed protein product [Aureobasidium mustum]|uniref:Uncharacterized protein n=1 Tax=Aureobasidium mustum TaxID=2773714 RepID=A0A9N8PFW4_9PEZI|nr:unnamed protein product [Aureobasidium mustum]
MDINADTNLSGALIFWAYIVGALACTGIVLNTIRQSYLSNGRPKIPPVLATLALSSFATLSYHMLNVLILSYQQWTARHSIPLGALIGANRTPIHLWQWSITSSLFQDFGEAIVATKSRYLLSSSGLWSTLAVAVYMGIEGRRCKVPNLWAFFALLEILPTSFAQTLFYIMLCTKPQPANSNHQSLSYWPFWYSVPLLYNYCLGKAPEYAGEGEWLIYTILAARVLLVLPLLLPLRSLSDQAPGTSPNTFQHVATLRLFTFSVGIQYLTHKRIADLGPWEQMPSVLFEALNSHPAVQALGYDLLHSVVAFGYWMLRREDVKPVVDEGPREQKTLPKKRR